MNKNHIEIIDELRWLIDAFCEISCTHRENAGSLSEALNKTIEKAIHDEFNTLYALHIEKLTAATGIELYALQTKNGMTIPERRRHWYTFWKTTPNPAAKQVEGKIYENEECFFQDLLKRTAVITELAEGDADAASEEATASEEPPRQSETPAEQPPAQPPATAQEKPAETWEEENAIPSETLSNPSER